MVGGAPAAVSADGNRIVLIDAMRLAVEQTILLEGNGKEIESEGIISQAEFSSDGRRLYVFGLALPPGLFKRGLRVVDLEKGELTAEALLAYQIQWVAGGSSSLGEFSIRHDSPQPNGSVFVFGTSDADLLPFEIRDSSPSMLWRLDGETLEVLEERAFEGFYSGQLAAGSG